MSLVGTRPPTVDEWDGLPLIVSNTITQELKITD